MLLPTLLITALCLFGLAFFTKRRFGVLGLGLMAGFVLSQQVAKEVATFLQFVDFPVEPLTFPAAAAILLILTPALLLLVAGPKYRDKRLAAIGALAFAVLGSILLLAPLSMSFSLTDPDIQPTLSMIALNTPLVVAIGASAAVIDMMLSQSKKTFGKKDKH